MYGFSPILFSVKITVFLMRDRHLFYSFNTQCCVFLWKILRGNYYQGLPRKQRLSKCSIKLDLIRGGREARPGGRGSSGVYSTRKVGPTLGQGRDKYRERRKKTRNICKKQFLRGRSTGARHFTPNSTVYISSVLLRFSAWKGKSNLGTKILGPRPRLVHHTNGSQLLR